MYLMIITAVVLTAVSSYLLGSLSFAVIVSRIYAKDDVRKHGSGNAGMTNVLRTYGKLPAAITLLGDLLKGVAAVLIGREIFFYYDVLNFDGAYLAGIFVLLGHLYPVFFGFKGGKGILTSCGIILVINPLVFGILIAVALPIMFLTKIVSIGSISAAVLYPIVTYLVLSFQNRPVLFDTCFAAVFTVMIIVMHRQNIKRLINGTENKFGSKQKGV